MCTHDPSECRLLVIGDVYCNPFKYIMLCIAHFNYFCDQLMAILYPFHEYKYTIPDYAFEIIYVMISNFTLLGVLIHEKLIIYRGLIPRHNGQWIYV